MTIVAGDGPFGRRGGELVATWRASLLVRIGDGVAVRRPLATPACQLQQRTGRHSNLKRQADTSSRLMGIPVGRLRHATLRDTVSPVRTADKRRDPRALWQSRRPSPESQVGQWARDIRESLANREACCRSAY